MRRWLATGLLATACVQSGVSSLSADSDTEPPPPPPEEICNGEDDDGDGEVDEGFADVDGDGVMDCVDTRCALPDPVSVEVSVDPSCPWEVPDRALTGDLERQWHWAGLASDPAVRNVLTTPVVGPLVDTNGDGRIDRRDTPSVAAVAFAEGVASAGTLVVLDGVTGEEQWTQPGWSGVGSLSLGDIDGDGWPDLVGFDPESRVLAVRGSGEPLWTGPAADRTNAPMTALADLDGDGTIEVLADDLILLGPDGRARARLEALAGAYHRAPSTVDLDGDGELEILFGTQVFDRRGRLRFEADATSRRGAWAAAIPGVNGGDPRVVFAADRTVEVRDADGGRLEFSSVLATSTTGPMCVADFDGDSELEVVFPSHQRLCMFELDGRERWCTQVWDVSGLAGCSAFDMDLNGTADVLYASERSFAVHSGAGGGRRFEDGGHGSGTLLEYPVIADIDDDGSAEIVVASNDAWEGDRAGITAWTHKNDGFAPSGRVWGQHAFTPGTRRSDGRVVRSGDPGCGVRARPPTTGESQNLWVTADGLCAASCERDGLVRVRVQVHNTGGDPIPAGIGISIYAVDADPPRRIETHILEDPLPAAGSVSVTFRVTAGDLADAVEVRADDDGSGLEQVIECDESDNRATWLELPCD